jgi:hypothetical protein
MLTPTDAGVDTWSPSWYVDPDGPAREFFERFATVRGALGSKLLPEPVGRHRVGWFGSGLVFAEGHPAEDRLSRGDELSWRAMELEDALTGAGVPLVLRDRPFASSGASSQGRAGVRRLDATLNMSSPSRAEGLAVLAGIAACVRSGPGCEAVHIGLDGGVETVDVLGYGGKRKLGRWYDKGLEAGIAGRGLVIRGEDQRRWAKLERRDVDELDGATLRRGFQRRFYPLWQATKGVTVAGPVVIAEKLVEAVAAGELSAREAEALCGHVLLRVVGGRRGAGISAATMYRREKRIREIGLQLADGVLEPVEINLAEVLEHALDADVWGSDG